MQLMSNVLLNTRETRKSKYEAKHLFVTIRQKHKIYKYKLQI
jgi:hypothetical protein